MRVAFSMFGDTSWTGGLNYLRNLFSALAELPGRPVRPVMFIPPELDVSVLAALLPYLDGPPIVVPAWAGGDRTRALRLMQASLLGSDRISLATFKEADIDLVFHNDVWYGERFPIPTIGWIADLQHCHLKHMFTRVQRAKRWLMYTEFCRCASRVMVSSIDARHDCETFFPRSRGKVLAVPFAVDLQASALEADVVQVLARYGLPARFIYFPGQLWRHKNHEAVVVALQTLRQQGIDVRVVATGNPVDRRHPDHPASVLRTVDELNLKERFRFLGLIPYQDIMPLMRASMAVLNPSLFEGWSTTVEEAKALGVPLLLSDLPVHREQAPAHSRFFDPRSSASIAEQLAAAWEELEPGPRRDVEREAVDRYRRKRAEFAGTFLRIAREAIDSRP